MRRATPDRAVFLIFLAAYRDRNHVEAATSSKLTIGTRDQDDAIALALATDCHWNVRFVPKADVLRCGRDWRYSITSSARASGVGRK